MIRICFRKDARGDDAWEVCLYWGFEGVRRFGGLTCDFWAENAGKKCGKTKAGSPASRKDDNFKK
jgi:hypothetical protein